MNEPLTIEDLRWFGLVAEAGGLTEAARQFGVSKSTLSRAISRAEACAGSPLFDRTGRGLQPTPLGEQLLPSAREAIEALRGADEVLRAGADAPSGPLRVGAVTAEANRLLVPALSELVRRHPAVQVDLRYASHAVDPVAADLDVCLRVGRPEQPHLVVRRVLDARLALFAAPDALLGVDVNDPTEVAALNRVCVALPALPLAWTLHRGEGPDVESVTLDRTPIATLNDPSAALAMVEDGAGLAFVPGFELPERLARGSLAPVLPDWSGPALEIYAVLPPGRAKVPAVRAFLDLMGERAAMLRRQLSVTPHFSSAPQPSRGPLRVVA